MASTAAARLASRVASPLVRASTDALRASSSASASADSVILIASTSNNIHATVSDLSGRVVARSSGGMLGYKHRARAAPQVGGEVAAQAAEKAFAAGHRVAHLHLKGPSRGRGQLLRGIVKTGLVLVDVRDVTPVPTPGTRPPAARRL